MAAHTLPRLQNYTFLPLRVTLGIVFVMHGYAMLEHNPLTNFETIIYPVLHLFCGFAILLGFFTRSAALIMATVTMFWMLRDHFHAGFFLNHGGYEYQLVLFIATFTLIHLETGRISLDNYFGFK
jgi:putative oxidoreductase